jgi:DNA repair exonuclease SbcCD ATPase subunit
LQSNVPETMSADADKLPQQIFDLGAKLGKTSQDLEEVSSRYEAGEQDRLQTELNTIRAAKARYEHPQSGYAVSTAQARDIAERIEQLKLTVRDCDASLAKAYPELDALAAAQVRHRNAIDRYAEITAASERRANVFSQFSALETEITLNPRPSEVQNRDTVMQMFEASIEKEEAEIRKAKEIISGFGRGNCPSCNTTAIVGADGKFHDIASLINTQKALLEEKEGPCVKDRQELEDYKTRIAKYRLDLQLWETWYKGLQARIDNLTTVIDNLPPEMELPDIADSKRVLERYEELDLYITNLKDKKGTAEFELASSYPVLRILNERLAELQDLAPTTDTESIEKRLAEITNNITLAATLSGRIQEAELHLTDLQGRLQYVEDLKSQSAGLTKYRELLSSAYGLLHRDAYPSVVARYFIDELNKSWNEILTSLDVKFAVDIQDDMSIKVLNADGDGFIEELSGGEKCCASLSFLMAVNRQFASKVGFLVMDEPTYGLDDDHLDRLRALVLDVQGYASANGLQIVMVTHEKNLKDSFQHVIEV